MFQAIVVTRNSPGRILIRLMPGLIFLLEGIQKFLNPEMIAIDYVQRMGFDDPSLGVKILGGIEIICALLILIGFLTRIAIIPLFLIICTFLYVIKFPDNQGMDLWIQKLKLDFCLIISLIYLFLYGAGKWSIDRWFTQRKKSFYDPI
ncbi:DoxX family protein [Solitalea koreensis]|uniref:Uncharacterized membrane protein YphA, DoxX/SURF4 family n=1 Tax=Solitalea koreensis TaxID=543615 RepID=A0A521AUU0_9SPHI|nr:DoxX family protein [Solitalea koreensis]SMO38577.1 Uncharacterized membrane protein YphA, DoxX/SURF4 family [Solitalea koreensis]